MIAISLAEIAKAIDGKLIIGGSGSQETLVSGSVETDSRLVKPGSLFFAKPGEVTDGHLFVPSAVQNGAIAAVVERHLPEQNDIAQIIVKDVVLALGKLAGYVLQSIRAVSDLKVIGITGSNGKTTTKNMLRAILSQVGETIAPIESYNNEVGAPYSMLQTTFDTKYLVVELGAGGPGSIAYLTEIAKPNIGVVLKVGLAHVGEFGGIETTAKIKAELPARLSANDLLILNGDDGYVRDMAELTEAKKISFGTSGDADYRATGHDLTIDGTAFELHWPDAEVSNIMTTKLLIAKPLALAASLIPRPGGGTKPGGTKPGGGVLGGLGKLLTGLSAAMNLKNKEYTDAVLGALSLFAKAPGPIDRKSVV